MLNLIDALSEIYHAQEFLREAIQLLCIKILKSSLKSVKIFNAIVDKLKLHEGKITMSSSDLSLFLSLRDIYLSEFDGQSKEHDALMHLELVNNKKHLQHANLLVKQQTYLYPRLHSGTCLLVKELFRDTKHFFKNFEVLFKTMCEDAIFNDEIHDNMKSVAKMKFLHIGFKITEQILLGLSKLDNKHSHSFKVKVVNALLLKFKSFRTMFVRNI